MLTPDDSGGFAVYSSTDRWRPGVTKLKWKNKKSGENVSQKMIHEAKIYVDKHLGCGINWDIKTHELFINSGDIPISKGSMT